MLMRYGVEKADKDGWMMHVNGSVDAKVLYGRFAFQTLKESDFGPEIKQIHMKR